jgi:hypothetical protein
VARQGVGCVVLAVQQLLHAPLGLSWRADTADTLVLRVVCGIWPVASVLRAGKGGKRSARDSQYIRSILAGVNPAAPGDAQVHGQLVMKGQAAITAAAAAAAAAASGGAPSAAAPAAAAAPVEDDDIFGDAGTDYAPVIPQKKGAAAEGRRAEGLFSSREHQEALQAPPQHAVGGGGAVDMDTEEGELPGQRRQRLPGPPSEQQQQAAGGYPGYPAQGSWQQQQQQQVGVSRVCLWLGGTLDTAGGRLTLHPHSLTSRPLLLPPAATRCSPCNPPSPTTNTHPAAACRAAQVARRDQAGRGGGGARGGLRWLG